MIYIRNMVCDRCVMVVREIFTRQGIGVMRISLGEVDTEMPLTVEQKDELMEALEAVGFEIIDDKRSKIVERVKSCIRELVHRKDNQLNINLSDYLSEQLNMDYSSLTTLFSEMEGSNIEKYFIAQKIERVKELLVYDDLTLSEIAHLLNYSSTAHLSGQFKKVTGLTPGFYRKMGDKRRKPLDKV